LCEYNFDINPTKNIFNNPFATKLLFNKLTFTSQVSLMSRYFEHADLENDFLIYLSSSINSQVEKDSKFENLDDKWSKNVDRFIKNSD